MDLEIPLGGPQGSQGLVSCGAMQVRSPFDPEKQLYSSYRVDDRNRGAFSRDATGLSHLPSCFESVLR